MITLTTLSSLNDAFVLRSMLEASEIPAFIPDETICQMDWGYINAIGGVRVQIPEEFSEPAKVVLGEFKDNLNRIVPEALDPISSFSGEPVFPDKKTPRKPSEAQQPSQSTSTLAILLAVLAFATVALFGFLVMRSQARKAALIEAIGAYHEGNFDLAIADYSRGIELGAKTAQIYFDRGAAYAARGDQNNSTADYNQAIADYSKTIEIDADFTAAYGNRGSVYLDIGEYDNALSDLDKAIQFNPQDEAAYFRRGYVHQQIHKDDEALSDFKLALALNPNDVLAYANRGIIHDNRGEFDLALSDFTQALQIDPKEKTSYLNRARVYFEKKDFAKAIVDYSQALALSPQDKEAYLGRGNAHADKGDYAKALTDYAQAISIASDYKDSYTEFAWLLSTCPKVDFRDGKKAVELATKACTLSGWKEPSDWDTLAVAYAEAGDFANAMKWEREYIESPNQKADDLVDAKKRLVLFENHQPYHEGK